MMMGPDTMAMSINKDYHKELEFIYSQMVIRQEESIIRINYMALSRLHLQEVTLIGGKSRMIRRKDMEHKSGLMETDTLGSGFRMSNTAMEYSDGQMEMYIMDNGNKIILKVMDIKGRQMALSIMDSTRMIR
jgi:hypothetical protein